MRQGGWGGGASEGTGAPGVVASAGLTMSFGERVRCRAWPAFSVSRAASRPSLGDSVD